MENTDKKLVLKSRIEEYKKDGITKTYTKYYVEVLGIELQLNVADNTARLILSNYFNLGGEK